MYYFMGKTYFVNIYLVRLEILFLIISGIKIILIASFSQNTYKVQNSNVENRFGSHI